MGDQHLDHGWLPTVVEALALLIALVSLWRFGRRWPRWLPVAAAVAGIVVAGSVAWYLHDEGITGDPAPARLWWWLAVGGFWLVVAALGWRWAGWRAGVLSCATALLCVLSIGLTVNAWVGYFPTVHSAWAQLTVAPLPGQTDRMTVTAMQLSGERPEHGVVVPVTTTAEISGFGHRTELVYLPPAWFATNPPPELPVVMMLGSQLNLPSDWLRAGNASNIIENFATAHRGMSPIFVFPDATGAFDNDTECVDGPRGNASTHLTEEVVPFVISDFGASADPRQWGIVGWSMGGTCAAHLATRRPDLFGSIVDIAGDLRPNAGTPEQTLDRLFGGDEARRAQFDPATVIRAHGRYADLAAVFVVPGDPARRRDALDNPEGQDVAADTLCRLGMTHGIDCSVQVIPGKHDWTFAGAGFDRALPWLAGRLGTPGLPEVAPPGTAPQPQDTPSG
ncbi:esterase family protein [Mycolicibacterium brumae]|uniref:Esterase family protein n=1 Tax=Mycolicibacterium brumae TaxID=85968 RepID=A0A2G5P8R8_9MYCO|nr:esterase family protein [Mycolicibacterium brumae]PIB74686.1 hypothetical protein CQY22_012020 [Mycolicibacterium brumae]